jgi:hypothetical protein
MSAFGTKRTLPPCGTMAHGVYRLTPFFESDWLLARGLGATN